MSTELATRPEGGTKSGLKGVQKAAALLVAIGEQRASEREALALAARDACPVLADVRLEAVGEG